MIPLMRALFIANLDKTTVTTALPSIGQTLPLLASSRALQGIGGGGITTLGDAVGLSQAHAPPGWTAPAGSWT
jgi:hypothetical protein